METFINFEMFGKNIVRFSLPDGSTEENRNAFLAPFWIIQGERDGGNDDVETYTLTVKQWIAAVKTLRIMRTANWFHNTKWNAKSRVRKQYLASGLRFQRVEQRNMAGIVPEWHNIGNANGETIRDEWTGFRSQFEPVPEERD